VVLVMGLGGRMAGMNGSFLPDSCYLLWAQ
jgi:hypothetical protein